MHNSNHIYNIVQSNIGTNIYNTPIKYPHNDLWTYDCDNKAWDLQQIHNSVVQDVVLFFFGKFSVCIDFWTALMEENKSALFSLYSYSLQDSPEKTACGVLPTSCLNHVTFHSRGSDTDVDGWQWKTAAFPQITFWSSSPTKTGRGSTAKRLK